MASGAAQTTTLEQEKQQFSVVDILGRIAPLLFLLLLVEGLVWAWRKGVLTWR